MSVFLTLYTPYFIVFEVSGPHRLKGGLKKLIFLVDMSIYFIVFVLFPKRTEDISDIQGYVSY